VEGKSRAHAEKGITAPNKAPPKKKIKHGIDHGHPKLPRDVKFCQRWLEHHDAFRAYREAGYPPARNNMSKAKVKVTKFWPYLEPLMQAKARVVAEKIGVTNDTVLREMASKALYNPGDYLEVSPEPISYTERDPITGKDVTKEDKWFGKSKREVRYKPLEELTADQLRAVEIVAGPGGRLSYRLPTIREQHQYLTSLGRQMGMFMEKIILENRQTLHQHAHLHLENVPTEMLEQLRTQLLPLVGADFARQLGFTPAEVEEAAKTLGVLMPDKR
jgi:hypothetical protein